MCRLSGVVFRDVKMPDRYGLTGPMLLSQMLLENSRTSNKDGTGIAVVRTGATCKAMVSADTLFDRVETDQFFWAENEPFDTLIGHVRLSTTARGKQADRHAHPYRVGNWLLAHNGHISNHVELHKELGLPEEVEVDSEIALHAMAKVWGHDAIDLTLPMLKAGLDQLEGGYAFIIANVAQPDRLYLVAGSNPLNVYANERVQLVNTDSALLGYLNRQQKVSAIATRWYMDFALTKLEQNHAYILQKDAGLVMLGEFTPKVVTRKATYVPAVVSQPQKSTTRTGQSVSVGTIMSPTVDQVTSTDLATGDRLDLAGVSNVLNMDAAVTTLNTLVNVLGQFRITMSEMTEMLVSLPTIVPSVPYNLNLYQLRLVQKWMAYLVQTGRLQPDRMDAFRGDWSFFNLQSAGDPYTEARKVVPGFLEPFYINEYDTLRKVVKK